MDCLCVEEMRSIIKSGGCCIRAVQYGKNSLLYFYKVNEIASYISLMLWKIHNPSVVSVSKLCEIT